jgi:hypothetical protein
MKRTHPTTPPRLVVMRDGTPATSEPSTNVVIGGGREAPGLFQRPAPGGQITVTGEDSRGEPLFAITAPRDLFDRELCDALRAAAFRHDPARR